MTKKLNDKELMCAIYKCSELRYEILKLELKRERAARKRLEQLVLRFIDVDNELNKATDELFIKIVERVHKLEDENAQH